MAMYYFDVRAGSTVVEDEHGADFPDRTAAEAEARAAVLELAKYKLLDALDVISVEVRDATGRKVLSATASVSVQRDGS